MQNAMLQQDTLRQVRLTLGGIHLPADQDPLSVWEFANREHISYAAGSNFEGLIWRVELPRSASAEAARAYLRGQQEEVRVRVQELDEIAARLARLNVIDSYVPRVSRYESELLAAVAELNSPALAFDTRTAELRNYKALYAQCEALLAQFKMLIRPILRVETLMGGKMVGLTTVNWDGDHQTIWMEGTTPDQMEAQLAAVRLAMASRQALLKLLGVVVTGALGLAMKAHIPGGQILLLPAVYRFVRDVLQELKHLPDGTGVR
jgi:hypothetical protein